MNRIKRLLNPRSRSESVPKKPTPFPVEIQPFIFNTVPAHVKHIIAKEHILIHKELGMGQFGIVQQGVWCHGNKRLHVAIKCLGSEGMSSDSIEFLKEAAVMNNLDHPNVLRLYGVVLHFENLMLITELATFKSLLECLRDVDLRHTFPVATLCHFAEQICDGMTYLEQKRLVHRDVAARNILVFRKNRVKISDFGLSRALDVGKDYYQSHYNANLKLPVAWCAPECILYLRFTMASDVWAFGVCMWEMFTYGFQPWLGLSGHQILEAIDRPKCQRLERPECCPDKYYTAMLHCWEHSPSDRPKFKDLGLILRKLRPEQVITTSNYVKPKNVVRGNHLEYKAGEKITILTKECMNSGLWYGVMQGGRCGVFNPENTKPYTKEEHNSPSSQSALPSRNSARLCRLRRPILSRSDVKRHTYQGKHTLQRSMISSPQGDVKHTGHLGIDGAYFGDIPFLNPGSYAMKPHQSADDMEVPLLNSPSHTKAGRCKPPYPRNLNLDFYEVNLPYLGPLPMRTAHLKSPDTDDEDEISLESPKPTKPSKKSSKNLEPTTSRSIMNRVKSATIGRSRSADGAASVHIDIHEYNEISDTDTESPNGNTKASTNLVDNTVSVANRLLRMRRGEPAARSSAGRTDKRKIGDSDTMKPMSAHDVKTLDTAVALANEITNKSMSNLDPEPNVVKPASDKVKVLRSLKFGAASLHHESDKAERRSFSEEAKNVRDIQATLSEESKKAYTSLIEEPTPYITMKSVISDGRAQSLPPKNKPPPPQQSHSKQARSKSKVNKPRLPTPVSSDEENKAGDVKEKRINELPLPPRASKPKLVDKLRHFRKYPLKIPAGEMGNPNELRNEDDAAQGPIIYENAIPSSKKPNCKPTKAREVKLQKKDLNQCAGTSASDINSCLDPIPGPSTANPFERYQQAVVPDYNSTPPSGEPYSDQEAPAAVKKTRAKAGRDNSDLDDNETARHDHVSVEDLLQFADKKPCGRQRGAESDEVRIMLKVLKQEPDPDECLQALEITNWDVHQAIKVMRVKLSIGDNVVVTLDDCARELAYHDGDVIKAIAILVLSKPNRE